MMVDILILSSFFILPNLLPEMSRAETGVEATPSISISPSSVASLNLDPRVFGSTSQTVEVTTSNYTGYTLRFKTVGASTDLTSENNDMVIPTISEILTSSEFISGYGYSMDGEHYKPVPSVSSEVGDLIDTTDAANSEANSYSLSFGVKAPADILAGTYSNQFQLTATPNDVGYFISYDDNSEDDDVSGMPSPATQQGQMSGLEVYLSNAVPTRPGYVFLGWSENSSAAAADYEAGGTFALDPETENIKTLYAIWDGIEITYDANGGKFPGYWDDELDEWVEEYDVNQAVYNDTCQSSAMNIFKENSSTYSMTSMTYNIYEAYAATDFQGSVDEIVTLAEPYANNMTELDVMTFPGAEYLEVELMYSVPDEDDMIGVVPGAYFSVEDAMADLGSFVFGTYGTDESVHTWSGQVTGDTVTIGIVTDGADGGLGYFAQVRGYDSNGVVVETHYHISNAPDNNVYLYTDNVDLANADFASPRPSSNLIFETVSFPDAEFIIVQQAIWELGESGRVDVYLGKVSSLEEAASATLLGTFSGSGSSSNTQMPVNEFTMVYQSNEDGGYGAIVNGYDSNWNSVTGYRLYTAAGDGSFYHCRTKGRYSTPQRNDYRFIGWSEDPNATTIDVGVYESQVIQEFTASGGNTPVTLYAVWQRLYSVAYDGNGADEGVMGTPHKNLELGSSIDLIASNFSREGYGFAGWNTKADGSGVTYGPNETATLNSSFIEDADANLLVTLYALWVPADQNDTLQTFTSSNRCDSMSVGDVLAFTDTRDNDTYAVAKLADGKCWMIENLRLDDSVELSETNTNHPSLPLINSFRIENGKYVVEETSLSLSQSSWSWSCGLYTNGSSEVECYGSLLNAQNTLDRTTTTPVSQWSYLYSFGNYYNIYSATSGNIKQSNSGINGDYIVGGDLCPKGWHLPTGTESGEYASLISAVNSTTSDGDMALRQFPNNYVSSGYFYKNQWGGTIDSNIGVYWSSSFLDGYSVNTLVTAWNPFAYETSFTEMHPGLYYINSTIEQLAYSPSSNIFTGLTIRCISGEWDYSLSFDANGGFGGSPSIAQETPTFRIGDEEPTRSEYTFLGWATEPNATIASYARGDTFIATNQHTILYAVWEPIYIIKYDGNGATSGEMNSTKTVSENAEFRPNLSLFSRDDYGFVGWSTSPNAQPGDGVSTIFGPSETIIASNTTLGQSVPATVTFYAVWVAKDTVYNLQTFASNDHCSAMSQGDIIALQDARDSNVYAVAKLADGNCWMIENLRLKHNETSRNWGDDALSQGFGGDFIGLSDPEYSYYNNTATSNTLYNTGNSNTLPRYNDYNYGRTYFKYISIGNFYTWAAAIADTTPHTIANESVTTTSICPAGWRLPTGGENGDFYNLNYVLNNNQNVTNSSILLRAYPANFVLATGYYDNNGESGTTNGYYWSSTNANNTQAKYMYITKDSVNLAVSMPKYDGLTIRCVVSSQ